MAKNKENNTVLFVLLGGAGLLLVGAIVGMKFFTKVAPPPPPLAQTAPQVLPINTPIMYRGVLDEDARRFGVPKTSPDEIATPLEHTVELSEPRALKAGDSLDTPHLRISLDVVKEWAKSESGQGFRYEHLILSVANKSDAPLAYRVVTTVPQPERCKSKGAIEQNALALQPGERAQRTECLFHAGMPVTVKAAETVRLPPLGYYYVSRLLPSQIGLDPRTSSGHTPPRETQLCKFVPWHDIESSGASWADVVDFYARHNCDEYAFYKGYRFRTAPGPLPAHE